MAEVEVLTRIHEDLEVLKRDMAVLRELIGIDLELKEEVKEQVRQARKRIAKGEFVSNKDILKEFDLE